MNGEGIVADLNSTLSFLIKAMNVGLFELICCVINHLLAKVVVCKLRSDVLKGVGFNLEESVS